MNKFPTDLPEAFILKDLVRRCELTATLLRRFVEESIIDLIPLSDDEIQEVVDDMIGVSEREEWLAAKGWSIADCEISAARTLALKKFAKYHFSSGLEDEFLATRGGRDEIVYSLLRVRDAGLARELFLRIAEGELAFPEAARHFGEGPEARHQGLIGPIRLSQLQPQFLADALRGLQPGELAKPLVLGEWHLIMRLEHFSPSRLDETMRQCLLNEQLDAFLDDRVRRLQADEPVEKLTYTSDS